MYQAIEGNIKFVDMYWARREGLEHYYTWLARRRDERGYRYGNHHFPHDIKVSELQTGNTRYEFLRKLGMTNMKVAERPLSIADDIETLRPLFGRIIIDETRCKRLAEAITAYRRDWDKKLGRYKDAPLHNEASHFVDPLRLLPQFWKETDEQYDINGEKRQGVTVTSVF